MENRHILILALFISLIAAPADSRVIAGLEAGAVKSYYNDLRIPGDSGSDLSLTDDLSDSSFFFYRLRGSYSSGKHLFSALYAPLTAKSRGRLDRDIKFRDKTFQAGEEIRATFRFDSYRFTYRNTFITGRSLVFGAGLTGKIRDAEISLESGTVRAEKKNRGFVPLINFALQWNFLDSVSLLMDGDALFSTQGRAEDISVSLQYQPVERIAIRAGYRLLEGGADNDEVYTFSLFNYLFAGFAYSF